MTLEELQREMAAAVMQPLTADESMQARDTIGRWQGSAMQDVAAGFIKPNDRLTAFDRLEIYNRQYWFRLQNAFSEDFPALRSVVGAERFEQLANAYLEAHPSRSFTLRNLGSRLHGWLAENPAYAGRRLALALDVVRVEWACIEAFDNAELPPLSARAALTIDGESKLRLQPHLQLLSLSYPADDLVLAMHQQQKRELSEAGSRSSELDEPEAEVRMSVRKRPTWVTVHRADNSLYYRRLSQAEYLALSALGNGHTLAEAIEAAFEHSTIAVEARASRLQEWFSSWAQLGWICQPDLV